MAVITGVTADYPLCMSGSGSGGAGTVAWLQNDASVNIKNNENKNMEKFYRVKKDTPAWLAGAIIKHDGQDYKSVNDLFDQEWTSDKYYECFTVVEKATEWFERVWPVMVDGGEIVYKVQEEARKHFTNKIA